MPLFVYFSKQCVKDAKSQSRQVELDALKDKVEGEQHTRGFDHFLPTPFIKKSLGKTHRLLGYEYLVEDDLVVCFLRLLARGNREYEDWLNNYDDEDYRRRLLAGLITEAEVKSYVAEQRCTAVIPAHEPPTPEEASWLELAFDTNQQVEDMVLESREWVEALKDPFYQGRLSGLVNLLQEALAPAHSEQEAIYDSTISAGILLRRFPRLRAHLLVAPYRSDSDLSALRSRHEPVWSIPDDSDKMEEVLRQAQRSYPAYLVADMDVWFAVEKEDQANLALSPEEHEVLRSVRRPQYSEPAFPLFINGRAGSGKSTMLQYLMRDYLDFACTRDPGTLHPLYMTSSSELRSSAMDNVRRLMHGHADFLIRGSSDPESARLRNLRADEMLAKCFRVFREYLLGLLPPEMARRRFRMDRFVGLPQFRRLWTEHFAKRPEARRLSADIAWHAIRTYIKGMAVVPDETFDIESYQELPRKQRTLTTELFRRIYGQVWDGWYRSLCESAGYWDDQDLASELLRDGRLAGIHPAVFCDEAQDFTRIELELIFRLSLFSVRSVEPYMARRIPFAFAGDELQTLNPTGFRWDAVSAFFHEKVAQPLDSFGRSRLSFNYKVLARNYRSSDKIVRFCNLIQFLRMSLFTTDSQFEPQVPWRGDSDSPLPAFFDTSDPAVAEAIAHQQDLVIIVNCEEGEEAHFAENDPLLKRVVKRDEAGVPRNVLSSMRAKGLEFSRVVLYQFGETCPPEVGELLLAKSGTQFDPDRHLPSEYFLNRLYVAASRPQQSLLIVDTTRAREEFWGFARKPEMIEELLRQAPKRIAASWTPEAFCYLQDGQADGWSRDRQPSQNLATNFRDRGLAERDPYLLRQARLAYMGSDDHANAELCLAHALLLEGKVTEAGNKFVELRRREDAVHCFWTAAHFKRLADIATEFPEIISSPKHRVAEFMAGPKDADRCAEIIRVLEGAGEWTDVVADDTWVAVARGLLDALHALPEDALSATQWQQGWKWMSEFHRQGSDLDRLRLGELAFRANRYVDAVRLWEGIDRRPDHRYRRAKAEATAFPDNLEWFLPAEPAMLVASVEANGGVRALRGPRPAYFAADAYLQLERFREVLEILSRFESKDRFQQLQDKVAASAERSTDLVMEIQIARVRVLLREKSWRDAFDLANEGRLDSMLQSPQRGLPKLDSRAIARGVSAALIEWLAASDDLARDTAQSKQSCFSHLRNVFVTSTDPKRGPDWSGWRGLVPLEVAGAAVERSGRDVDALSFYEWADESALSDQEKRFVVERLIHVRERRTEELLSRDRKSDAMKQRKEMERLRRRASWLTKDAVLPEYPALATQPPAAAPPIVPPPEIRSDSETRWSLGGINFAFSPAKMRLMIENVEEYTNATLDLAARSVSGGGEFVAETSEDGRTAWRSDTWGMAIELRTTSPGDPTLTVSVRGQVHSVRVALAVV